MPAEPNALNPNCEFPAQRRVRFGIRRGIVADSILYGTHPPVKAQPVVSKDRECKP